MATGVAEYIQRDRTCRVTTTNFKINVTDSSNSNNNNNNNNNNRNNFNNNGNKRFNNNGNNNGNNNNNFEGAINMRNPVGKKSNKNRGKKPGRNPNHRDFGSGGGSYYQDHNQIDFSAYASYYGSDYNNKLRLQQGIHSNNGIHNNKVIHNNININIILGKQTTTIPRDGDRETEDRRSNP